MKAALTWIMGLLVLLSASMVQAGTVYYWTDEKGVRHFSNTGPPQDAQDVGTQAETVSAPAAAAEPEEAPPAANEQDQAPPTPQQNQEGATPTVRDQFEAARQKRLARQAEDERRRLQAEIRQVEQRSLSRTFTEGMRAARVAPLREQLALLDADPDQYFRMKQEGAFMRGGRTSSNRDRRGGRTGAMREQLQQ